MTVMAQSIPTAHIPPPPPPGAFVGHLSFFQKILQMPHGGASTFIQIPTLGPQEGGKYLTHGTRSKFYLMIEAKNILRVFSAFFHGF